MVMTWWVWMVGALVLGFLEVMIPGYIFLGFALGAAATGVALAVTGPAFFTIPWIFLFFAAVSLVAWIVLRKAVGVRAGQSKIWDRDINED
ncbi:MAG: hypothetical protein HKN63_05990 [Rhodobacteraceae bacterium]|nr:hypothetical protein [Paracoccaceae bacterium]